MWMYVRVCVVVDNLAVCCHCPVIRSFSRVVIIMGGEVQIVLIQQQAILLDSLE
jgi:hypothetical protein